MLNVDQIGVLFCQPYIIYFAVIMFILSLRKAKGYLFSSFVVVSVFCSCVFLILIIFAWVCFSGFFVLRLYFAGTQKFTISGVPVLSSHLFPRTLPSMHSVMLKRIQNARELSTLFLIPWGHFISQSCENPSE